MSSLLRFELLTISVLGFSTAASAQWDGFVDVSETLGTDTYSFSGSRPAQVNSNENYYDGDFADFDGDGWPDRALGARYGLLRNTGDGLMTPFAGYTNFLLRGMPGASGWGEDAFQWVDVDGDGDLDNFSGGNGEPLTLQLNEEGRFRVVWQESVSALNIVNLDLEGDGDIDFVVAHAFCSDAACGHGCPAGTTCEVGSWPRTFTVLVNRGDATFDRVVSTARGLPSGDNLIMGVAAGDLDGDGDHDIVFINGVDRRLNLARNDGAGNFTVSPIDFAVPVRTIGPLASGFDQGMNLGDLDGDGDLDIVVALLRDVGTHPDVGHAIFFNDGAGGFTDVSATSFVVAGVASILDGGNGKLFDADYDGDLDFVAYAREAGRLDFFQNDGAGVLTYRADRSVNLGSGAMAIGNDTDIVDLDGDGDYDVWVGSGGARVRVLSNTYREPSGLPADMPRNLRAMASTDDVTLSWDAPAFAATARSYRVYRASSPGLHASDRRVIGIVGNRFQDDGLSAPVRETRVSYRDASAVPGATYFYSVSHVGTENGQSALTPEVAGTRTGGGGEDTTGPEIEIHAPTVQAWGAAPKIVVHYADGGSGVDASSVRVSFDVPLGGGARAAGADLSDLAYRRDGGVLVVPMPQDLALPIDTLVTMRVTASDRAGNESTASRQYFVRVGPSALPSASFTVSPAAGDAPTPVTFDATASGDSDGAVLAWEWYFGDGTTGLGRVVEHTYASGGTFAATLRVRDNDGGVSLLSRDVVITGEAAECMTGETRDCYAGPAGTEDVGACTGGTAICVGGRFGACEGATIPTGEVCANGVDDDCDGESDEAACGEAGADAGADASADGGGADAGVDADRVPAMTEGGCGCVVSGASSGSPALLALFGFLVWTRRLRA